MNEILSKDDGGFMYEGRDQPEPITQSYFLWNGLLFLFLMLHCRT